MAKKASKLVVLGIDGLMPELVRKFSEEGATPNLARLMKQGTFCEALPSPPSDTPTNWTTLATGAWTGTHGNNTFGPHIEGEPFTEPHGLGKNIFPPFASVADDCLNQLSDVEWFWEAAARAGKKCLLVNYPGGWPPNCDEVVTVDGAGPYCSRLVRLTGPNVYATREAGLEEGENEIHTTRPAGWGQLPRSARDPRETVFVITGETDLEPTEAGWIVARKADAPERVDADLLYCALVLASSEEAYDHVLIAKGKEACEAVATLKVGEWSDWISDDFKTQWGSVPGKFKLKLVELSDDARQIRLYRSTIFNTKGWAHPEEVADELIADILERGQIAGREGALETDGTNEDVPKISPLCQVRESIADQCVGIGLTCEYLTKTREWDVLWAQIHAPDGLNHQAMNGLCPGSPEYDPELEEETWGKYRSELANLDGLVGHLLEHCTADDTVFAVISDHGAIPTLKRIWVTHWFVEAGLVNYLINEETGKMELDLTRSKVVVGDHPLAQNVWANLKGRDPDGIVEQGTEYEEVCEQIINTLYSIRDPETGECPIHLAIRKRDAEWMGQWGPNVGDVIYFLAPGYANDVGIHSVGPIDPDRLPVDGMDHQTSGQQGVHHCYAPWARFGGFSVRGIFLLAGPGVRKGYDRQPAIWMPDVTPTLAALLNIAPPKHSEGTVIADLMLRS